MTPLKTLLALNRVAAPHGCRLNPAIRTAIERQLSGERNEIADLRDVGEADVTSTPKQFAEEAHHAES